MIARTIAVGKCKITASGIAGQEDRPIFDAPTGLCNKALGCPAPKGLDYLG